MKYEEFSPDELINLLRRAGEYPHPDLIDAIWEQRSEAEPRLLEIFQEQGASEELDTWHPKWMLFVHAGKFMISWRVEAAIPVLARFFMDDDHDDELEWFEEEPATFGPAAIPYMARALDRNIDGIWTYARGLSSSILAGIAQQFPESRDLVVETLRAALPSIEKIPEIPFIDEAWEDIAGELAGLGDESSREQILALYDAGLIGDGGFLPRKDYFWFMKQAKESAEFVAEPYDIRKQYRADYAHHERVQQEALRRQKEVEERTWRPASKRTEPKIGRNDPCPCGSGKKYKQCHGRPGSPVH